MERTRVLIVDDQPLFRQGIALALQENQHIEIIGETCPVSLLAQIEALNSVSADIVIYGNTSCGLTSLIVPWAVQKQHPNLKIIMMAPSLENDDLLNALMFRIVAYVERDIAPADVVSLVEEVADGGHPIYEMVLKRPELALRVINTFRTMVSADDVEVTEADPMRISRREMEVLKYIGKGYCSKQIATLLTISERTVRNHTAALFRKLGVHNRVEAVTAAIRQGIVLGELFMERRPAAPIVPDRPNIKPDFGNTNHRQPANIPFLHDTIHRTA